MNNILDLAAARRILGPDSVIGVSASSVEDALQACQGGADYLGIGTVYATPTSVASTSHSMDVLTISQEEGR